MRCFVVLSFLLLIPFLPALRAFASPPDTLWTRTAGGPWRDSAWDLGLTEAGGFIVAGTIRPEASQPVAVMMQLNRDGSLVWERTYGDHGLVEGRAVAAVTDDGFLLAGSNRHGQGQIVKTDPQGNVIWSRVYQLADGTQPLWMPPIRDICALPDGGCAAKSERGLYLIRCEADGDTLWTRSHGDPLNPSYGTVELPVDGFLLAATIYSCEIGYPCLYRLNARGEILWARAYSVPAFPPGTNLWMMDAAVMPDGGFAFCGYGAGSDWQCRMFAVRVNALGDTLWTRMVQVWNLQSRAFGIEAAADGGVLVCGSFDGLGLALIKLTPDGAIDWSQSLSTSDIGQGIKVRQHPSGEITCAGSIQLVDDFNRDLYVVQFAAPITGAAPRFIPPPSSFTLSAYPNPFNRSTTLRFALPRPAHASLRVYDLVGREVAVLVDELRSAGEQSVSFEADDLPSGVYLCRLEAAGIEQTQKLLLLK